MRISKSSFLSAASGKALLVASLASVAAAGISPIAIAQEQPRATGGLEEIVVTAQRREESLQDVPVAVSVVSGATLERTATFGTEALVNRVPSLTFQKGTTNVNSSLNMRGIGTVSFASGAEPSVSTVVDGVVYARPGQAFFDFMDLERVEVLRGPQSTLFGRNASAGVVSFTTKAAPKAFMASGELAWFEGDERRVRGSIGGPLGDNVQATITAVGGKFDGDATNVFNGKSVQGYDRAGLRARVDVQPSETLSLTFIGDYVNSADNCCADAIGLVFTTNPVTGAAIPYNRDVLIPSLRPVVTGAENKDIDNNAGPATKDQNWGYSVGADWDVLNGHTVSAIAAYRGWKNTEIRDGDFRSDTPAFVRVPGGVTDIDRDWEDFGVLDFRQQSLEVRIASPTDQFLEYVAGVFAYKTDQDNFFKRDITACTASAQPANALGLIPCAPGSSTIGQIALGTANWNTKFTNQAIFGQATFNFTDALRGIVGGRFTTDEIEYSFARTATVAGPAVAASFAGRGSVSNEGFSGKLGVQYDINDAVMAYGTYSRGYKGPAVNIFFNMAAANQTPVQEETSDAFEVGLKTSLLDNRMTLNVAAFNATYDGFQANSFILVNGAPVSNLANAGEVSTQGFEADVSWAPIDGVRINGGVAYADAKIDNFPCPAGAPLSCQFATGFGLPANTVRLNGSPLPFAPEWKTTLNGEWTLPVDLPFEVRLNGAYVYTSDSQYDLQQSPFAIQDAYGILDAGLVLASKTDNWRVSFFGKNLTDEFYTVTKVLDAQTVRQRAPRDSERYFGVSLRLATGG
jgi:iron complex outermembrane receptor protein